MLVKLQTFYNLMEWVCLCFCGGQSHYTHPNSSRASVTWKARVEGVRSYNRFLVTHCCELETGIEEKFMVVVFAGNAPSLSLASPRLLGLIAARLVLSSPRAYAWSFYGPGLAAPRVG